jgi:hypothetical protein
VSLPQPYTPEQLEPFLELVRPWLQPQPAPELGENSQSVTDRASQHDRDPLVLALLAARREQGRAAYGTELLSCNGRDARLDYLQELVDALAYAWQALLEAQGQQRYVWQIRVGHIRGQLVAVAQELRDEQRGGRD